LRTGITYCRKSTTTKGLEVEQGVLYQLNLIKNYAEFNKVKIIKSYNDVGYSGANTDRPELQEMLLDLKSEKINVDVLLIYSVDRLGRDLEGNIAVFLEIIKYVKEIIFVSEGMISSSEMFKPFFLWLTGSAQAEKEKINQRMRDGRKAKVLVNKNFDGSWLPLGYVLTKENGFRLQPATIENTDDYSQQIGLQKVKFIFYSYLFGMNTSQIATSLNKHFGNTRRGVPWTYKSIRYILTNTVYIGKLKGCLEEKYHYSLNDSNVEPLINPVLFELVQKRLETNTKSVLNRYPFFTLCSSCGNFVQNKDRSIQCIECNESIKMNLVIQKLSQTLKTNLYCNYSLSLSDTIFDLKRKYEWKVIELKRRLNSLDKRRVEIEQMDRELQSKSTAKMMNINSMEIVKISKQLSIEQSILGTLDMNYLEKLLPRIKHEFLQQLFKFPYVLFINFQQKKVRLFFHKNELDGV
jgi:DNA invertase Pin-like site-specific DNA recombinase